MRRLLYAALACCCPFLMGCPLQTETPIISELPVTVPGWLPGRWAKLKDGSTAESYLVKADPDYRARLQLIIIGSNGQPDMDRMRPAMLAAVKGGLFLSVYEAGDETTESGYYHFALEQVSGGDLQLVPLKEFVVSSAVGGDELAAFIATHGAAEYLHQKDAERYRKQK